MKTRSNTPAETYVTVRVDNDGSETLLPKLTASSWSKGGALIMAHAQTLKREGYAVEGRGSRRGYSVYSAKGGQLLFRLEFRKQLDEIAVQAVRGGTQIRHIDLKTEAEKRSIDRLAAAEKIWADALSQECLDFASTEFATAEAGFAKATRRMNAAQKADLIAAATCC